MDIAALKAELDSDPNTRGYSGMTDHEAADDINTVYEQRDKDVLTGEEMRSVTVNADFVALTEHKQSLWVSFCSSSEINPFLTANEDLVKFIFGVGSATVAALLALRVEDVSRGEKIGIGFVKVGNVEEARRL